MTRALPEPTFRRFAFLGGHDGRPAVLMERYAPSYDAVGGAYDVTPGDIGMHAERVRAEVSDDEKLLSIFTDIFDCIFRFLSPLLDREGLLTPAEFWSAVADAIRDYQQMVDLTDVAGSLQFAGTLDNPIS